MKAHKFYLGRMAGLGIYTWVAGISGGTTEILKMQMRMIKSMAFDLDAHKDSNCIQIKWLNNFNKPFIDSTLI